MKYRASPWLAMVCLLVGTPVFGQDTFVDSLRDHVSIRQSLRDQNTINEPAFATLTFPDEGPTVNVIAVAATAFLKPISDSPRYNVGAAFQFNQNSATDERENVFVGGMDIEARTGGDYSDKEFYFARVKGTAGYKRNGEDHTDGMTANVYLTYEKNRPDADSSSIPLISSHGSAPTGVKYVWLEFAPQVGLEFDNAISAASAANEGKVTRGLMAAKFNAFPVRRFPERLVLSADIAYRYDMQTDFDRSDRDHPFAQFSVSVMLDPFKIFSIAVDRVIGEDATQDFDGPAFTRLAFKVQLSRPQSRSIARARTTSGHPARPHII